MHHIDPYELIIRGKDRLVGYKDCLLPLVRRMFEPVKPANPLMALVANQQLLYHYVLALPCQNQTGKQWNAKLWYEDETGKHEVQGHHAVLQLQWYALEHGIVPPLDHPIPLWPKSDAGSFLANIDPYDSHADGRIHGSLMFDYLFYARDHEEEADMFWSINRPPKRINTKRYPLDGVFYLEWRPQPNAPLVIEAICKGHANKFEYNRFGSNRDNLARFQILDIRGHEALVELIDNPIDTKWGF